MDTDENKPLSKLAKNSLEKRAKSSVERVLDARMTVSEAVEAATQIVRCYPNGGKNADKGYIGALTAILGKYPRQISLRCAEPTTGIVLECKFLPTVADLVEWLEKQTEPLRQHHARDLRIQQQLDDRQQFEGIQVARSKRLSLFELKEKYGDWHDNWRQPGLKALEAAEVARAMLIAELGENGADIFDALPDAAE